MAPKELLASSELLIKVGLPSVISYLSFCFQNFTSVYDTIGNLTKEEIDFENVIKAMIDNEGESTRKISAITVKPKQ